MGRLWRRMYTEETHSFETLKVNAIVTSSISGSVGTTLISFMTLHILMYGLIRNAESCAYLFYYLQVTMLLQQYRWDISFLNYIYTV